MERLLNLVILILLPPLFIGIINKIKAFWSGRKGAPILQPYYDIIKLLYKSEVPGHTSSVIFYIFPVIYISSVLAASILLPVIGHKAVVDFDGSFIMFAYILAAGKFMSIAGAMDTGSSFEGMGAARESFFTSFVEPSIFIVLGSIAVFADNASFNSLFSFFMRRNELILLVVLLCIIIIGIIMMVEGGRIPIDDPNTHLELTMIHEVMVLDNSGPSLGMIQYASSVKIFMFATLLLNFIIPYGIGTVVFTLFYLAGMAFIAVIIGTIESMVARLRLVRIPEFLFLLIALAIMVMFIVVIYFYGGR